MSSDEARAEAERRMHEQRESVGLMVVEQARFVEGFVQGAEWQAERDAERIAELEAEVERLNDALDAADVRYQMLGDWSERMKAEAEHLRGYAEKQDELIHRLRGRAEAAEEKITAVRAYCIENTEGMPDDPFAYGIQQLRRVLAVLDGGDET